ncbi:MAG: hypothetical protein JRC90_09875 [Deltaproteobacteria bacterium]|nr:hypothetical protein [Deltaproteobacteria bacterium]
MTGRKHAALEIGGEIYNLRISYNAMCDFLDSIGSLDLLEEKALIGYRGMLWAGINNCGNKTITIEQAGDLCEQYIIDNGHAEFLKTMTKLISDSEWIGNETGKNRKKSPKKASEKSLKNTEILPSE